MSILSHPPLPLQFSRKRTPSAAFDVSPPVKRACRPAPAHTRPDWVVEREAAPRVDARIDAATTRMDVRRAWGVEKGVVMGGLLRGGTGFTVLCFGEEMVQCVGDVVMLVGGMGAKVFGVGLVEEGGRRGGKMDVLLDSQRVLTGRLGLLHPLGGGRTALDAIVVLDSEGRVRMVLPVGWGVRGGGVEAGNRWENVVGRLVRGLEWLRWESVVEVGGCRDVEMVMA